MFRSCLLLPVLLLLSSGLAAQPLPTPAALRASVDSAHAARTQAAAARPAPQRDAYRHDYAALVTQLARVLAHPAAPDSLRQLAAASLLALPKPAQPLPEQLRAAVHAALPPASPYWTLAAYDALPSVYGTEPGRALQQQVLAATPNRWLQGRIRIRQAQLQYYDGQEAAAYAQYPALKAAYGQYPDLAARLEALNPDRPTAVGKRLPAFAVPALAGGDSIRHTDLRGHYTLLDFWAVWCAPCIREMPNLHRLAEQYAGRGLRVLSLSFDAKPADVADFRARRFPMPWQHAFVPGGFDSDLATRFQVVGIPKVLLVGPDGVIVAADNELKGAALEATLARLLAAE